jgi:fructose-1,6-bisphosphatase/inositol monophosphatase family enzyme
MNKGAQLREFLELTGERVSAAVREALQSERAGDCSRVEGKAGSDVIYAIDRVAEEVIVEAFRKEALAFGGIVLVAEGLGETETCCFPETMSMQDARWRVLMDPIDGTRGIMYDKRSAFFLAGAAQNHGDQTRLSDIEIAVMVEIPTTRAYLGDTFSATKGGGVRGFRSNLLTGDKEPISPKPSFEPTIRGGFAHFARFFSPGKEILSGLEETMLERLFPDVQPGEILTFEDQYVSTGGQLYELLTGKDRFVADLRATLYKSRQGMLRQGHVCHPYDLAAQLIGSEAGLPITDVKGNPLDGPFDTTTAMDWIGFANNEIREEIWPVLKPLLIESGFSVDT